MEDQSFRDYKSSIFFFKKRFNEFSCRGLWFKLNGSNSSSAGIGGFIKDRNNKILFIFSGPVYAITSFFAEICAINISLKQ